MKRQARRRTAATVKQTEELVTLDDGAQTTLERWGESGPVMLCVHGMASSRKSWERLAVHYAEQYRVYAYDQRGHGDSAGVKGPMTLHRALLDLYNVIDAISDKIDVLVGHSWGGAVAILGGRRFDANAVVAIDPMIRQADDVWYDEFLEELRALFAHKGAARDARIEREYAQRGWHACDIEGKKHAVASMTCVPIERLRDDNPGDAWDLREDLEAYPKPLLLLIADASESIVRLDDLKSVRERGGDKAVIRVIEGQGHNLHRTALERCTEEIDRFVGRQKESPA